MTRRAICLTHVSPVIEHRVETSKRRKTLYIGRRVTYHTDGARISLREFGGVTRRTRDVSRHFRFRSAGGSKMTDKTRHPSVLLRVVTKPREILSRLAVNVIVQGRGRWLGHVREKDPETEYA